MRSEKKFIRLRRNARLSARSGGSRKALKIRETQCIEALGNV
jgi:hypothetical protein